MTGEHAPDSPSEPAEPRGPSDHLFALRGAISFLTRIPVPGATRSDWYAFRASPWTFPIVGALIGGIAGIAFFVASPWTAAGSYLVAIYLLSGVTHADGLADLGDAIAVHDADRRASVMGDSALGVGGTLVLVITVIVTAMGALGVATTVGQSMTGSAMAAFAIVLAAEVGSKAGMALLICMGSPAHPGLGAALLTRAGPGAFLPVAILSIPVIFVAPPGAMWSVLAALFAGPVVAALVFLRVPRWLGGINGDVLGATNELGRAVALHAGVIVWTIG